MPGAGVIIGQKHCDFQWGSCEFPNSTQYIEASDPTLSLAERASGQKPTNDEALTLLSDVNGRMRTRWTERGAGWGGEGRGRKEVSQVCSYLRIPSWCLQGRCCWCRGPASGGPGSRTRPEGSRTRGAAECEITLIRMFKGAVWRGTQTELFLSCCFPLSDCGSYRVVHLKPWVHKSENVFVVTWLQADDVIDHIIHLWSN